MDTVSTASTSPGAESRAGEERAFRLTAGAILLLAAGLRLYDLDLKPFHHDEGVNGYFLTRLFSSGEYAYDPTNYHGPSLYYAALASTFLFGLVDTAVRFVTAAFGWIVVALALGTRRWLGDTAALGAALLLAASPGMVYFSRYFIHEMLLVAATLGLVVAARAFADSAHPGDLLAAAAWAAWMSATKETALPTAVVLALAVACAWFYYGLRHRGEGWRLPWAWREALVRERFAALGSALALFLTINVLLYSSFFTHAQGVVDAFKAYAYWGETGHKAHLYPFWTIAQWLWEAERPIVIVGALGLVMALWRAESRFSLFLVAWTSGMFLAYSLVPYKTPWLVINIVLPLALLAGYALAALAQVPVWLGRLAQSRGLRVAAPFETIGAGLAALALLASATVTLRQSVDLSFVGYDEESRAYVYAHTSRRFLDLVAAVDRLAQLSGQGDAAAIAVPAKEHWPLPWYLRRYKGTAYEDNPKNAREKLMVIGGGDQDAPLAESLGSGFDRVGRFDLRPGAELVLYARKDLARARP